MKIGNAPRICSAAKIRSVKRESLAKILQTVTKMNTVGMRSVEEKIDLIDATPTSTVSKEKLAFIPNVSRFPKTTRRIPKIPRKIHLMIRRMESLIGLIGIGKEISLRIGMISLMIREIPLIGTMVRRKTPRS